MSVKTVPWKEVPAGAGVFIGDYHFTSLGHGLEDIDPADYPDDGPDVFLAVQVPDRLPTAAQLLENWDEQQATDADGNGPGSHECIPDALVEALDKALEAVSEHLPDWFEQSTKIDLTGYPWEADA